MFELRPLANVKLIITHMRDLNLGDNTDLSSNGEFLEIALSS